EPSRRSPPTRPCEPHTSVANLSRIPSPLKRVALLILPLCVLVSACGEEEGSSHSVKTPTVAVNAPFSKTPYVGQTIADGAQLAADEANIQTDEGTYRLRIKRYDTGLSARRAVRNMRQAIADGAVAIVDEGTGINASWRLGEASRPPTAD